MLILSTPAFWIPAVVLLGAAVWDLATGQIPDAFPVALVAWAVASRLMGFQEALWVPPVLGLSLGLAIGLAAFRLGALGGGDGKLLAALGACLGAVGLLAALPWIALVGGLGALGARIRGRGEVVFGPALFLGYVLALSL